MDRVKAILLSAFQYEQTQVAPVKNDKAPTWWPHIKREYEPDKWATSPDPDSYPIDGPENIIKLGNKDIYTFVVDEVINKLLTPEENKIIKAFLGKGYEEKPSKASYLLHLPEKEAIHRFEKTLLKLKFSLDEHRLLVLYNMV